MANHESNSCRQLACYSEDSTQQHGDLHGANGFDSIACWPLSDSGCYGDRQRQRLLSYLLEPLPMLPLWKPATSVESTQPSRYMFTVQA